MKSVPLIIEKISLTKQYPAKVNEDTSISFKVANIGDTNVKANFIYKVLGPYLAFYRAETRGVNMLKGSVVTDIDRGWHPATDGGFTIICEAKIDKDTNPSNNSISLIGWAENTIPTPSSSSPTPSSSPTIPILVDPVTIVTPSSPPSPPPPFWMRN